MGVIEFAMALLLGAFAFAIIAGTITLIAMALKD